MKNVMRIVTVALTVVLMAAAFVAPASAAVAVDNLESLGQQTWTVVGLAPNATAPDVTDGVVSEGEYGDAIATVVPTDSDFNVSNWTAEGSNPLTDEELLEVAPERMTLYVTYDEEYLYMALVVVKAGFRSTADTPPRFGVLRTGCSACTLTHTLTIEMRATSGSTTKLSPRDSAFAPV